MQRLPWVGLFCCFFPLWGAQPARADVPLFARAGLGAGFGAVDSTYGGGDAQPSATGGLVAWDGALGVFVAPWLALHLSAFGSFAPNARSAVDGQRAHDPFWAQTTGAGLTLAPEAGSRRWPDYRGYVSASAGVALADAPLTHALGAGTQLVVGLERRLHARWWLGLAIQGVFQGRKALRLDTEEGYKSGHAALLLHLTYDARAPR